MYRAMEMNKKKRMAVRIRKKLITGGPQRENINTPARKSKRGQLGGAAHVQHLRDVPGATHMPSRSGSDKRTKYGETERTGALCGRIGPHCSSVEQRGCIERGGRRHTGTSALQRLHPSVPLTPRPSSLAPLLSSKASTLSACSHTRATGPRADRQLVQASCHAHLATPLDRLARQSETGKVERLLGMLLINTNGPSQQRHRGRQ